MVKKQTNSDLSKQSQRVLIFLCVCFVCFLALGYLYQSLILPISISLFLSYILSPIINWFGRYKIPRTLVVTLMMFVTIGLVIIASIKLLPALYSEIMFLIREAPYAFSRFSHKWLPHIKEIAESTKLFTAQEIDNFFSDLSGMSHLVRRVQRALSTLWETAPRVVGTVINLVLIPVLTFFILKEYLRLWEKFSQVIPTDLLTPLTKVFSRLDNTLREVLKGQFMVAVILGTLYVIGLSLVGLYSAVAIGIVSGICRLVPYLDVIVGLTLSFVVIFSDFSGWGPVLSVVVVFISVQTLDGLFITPKVIGERAGLHPLLIIVSVLALGDLFGFWGILLAIPSVALIKESVAMLLNVYYRSRFYQKL